MRRLMFFCLAAAAGTAAAQGTLKKIADANAITLGVRDASIPFSFLDDKQEAVGYSVDLCMKVVDAARKELASSKHQVVFVMQPLLAQELVRQAHSRPELANLTVIGLTQGTGRAILLKPPLMLEAS